MTSAENITLIKQLFDSCVDLETAQQDDYLKNTNCSEAVRLQVQRLLSHAQQITTLNETSAAQDVISHNIHAMSQQLHAGQCIGSYQIEEEIGRGGMGIVFLAHRADGQYQQKVAIKISPSFASAQELQRFHQERQILAQLQHANIAILLDGGSTDDNRPYLVMEHIQGQPITQYCHEKQLNLEQRLNLFLKICQAVSFAHSHLIIHRDIKPENILVSDEGQVKLLDFGISKALHAQEISQHTTMQQGLTLAYASPEQIRGEITTTLTDVYGLGALLYELISGQVPHKMAKNSHEEIIKNICLSVPPLPSAVNNTSNANHIKSLIPVKKLQGDLDNIVAKALRKEPNERYESVAALQTDIQNYLTGDEVLATKPSYRYKLKKLFQRHPVSSVLSVALLIALLSGLGISLYLNQALTLERDKLVSTQAQLQQEVSTSKEVITLLTNMFDAASPEKAQGKDISVTTLINSAVTHTQNSLANKPEIKARLLQELAEVNRKLGNYQAAINLLQESHELTIQHKKSPTALNYIALANAYRLAGDYPKTLAVLQSVQRQFNELSKQKLTAIEQAKLNNSWGLYYQLISKPKKAQHHFILAQEFWQLAGASSEDMLTSRFNLSLTYETTRQYDQAAQLQAAILAEYIDLLGENHPKVLHITSTLANSYRRLKRMAAAEELENKAYRIAKKILDPNTNNYNGIISGYSYFLHEQGKYQQAVDLLTTEINVDLSNKQALGFYYTDRAMMNLALGYVHKSLADLQTSQQILKPFYENSFAYMFNTYLYSGVSYALTGKVVQGKNILNDTLNSAQKMWGKEDITTAYIKLFQAIVATLQHDYNLAEQLLTGVTAINSKTFGEQQQAFDGINSVYADLYIAQQQWQQALTYLEKALIVTKSKQAPQSFKLILLQLKQGQVLWHLGKKKQAKVLITQAEKLIKQQLTNDSLHYQYAKRLINLITAE